MLSFFLDIFKFGNPMLLDKGNILFKGLVTLKRIMAFPCFPVFLPFFAGNALFALPAEFDFFSLSCTGDKRAPNGYPGRTLASLASALGIGIIQGTEAAGQATDSNLGIFDSHDWFDWCTGTHGIKKDLTTKSNIKLRLKMWYVSRSKIDIRKVTEHSYRCKKESVPYHRPIA